MQEQSDVTPGKHPPLYWVLLILGLALFFASWMGERQGWSSTITAVLSLSGAAVLVADSLLLGRRRMR